MEIAVPVLVFEEIAVPAQQVSGEFAMPVQQAVVIAVPGQQVLKEIAVLAQQVSEEIAQGPVQRSSSGSA